ncbi:uncharacterized protein LOC143018148 [Oratosquilla oratoria]|uniref:uncharacterized protein LOC143018148 n=1 Tax=Oratosquilla oratoria TaxID=337810 RepID=UPI003F75A879
MRPLLLLCLLGSAVANFGMIPERLLKDYTYETILLNCFGEEIMDKYMDKFKMAGVACYMKMNAGEPTTHTHEHTHEDGTVHTHEHTHEDGQLENHDHVHKEETVQQEGQGEAHSQIHVRATESVAALPEFLFPQDAQNVNIKYVALPFHYHYALGQGQRVVGGYPAQDRKKRHADHEEPSYVDKIINKVELTRCTLQELDFVDEEGQPKTEGMKMALDEFNVSSNLRADLYEAVDYCYDLAKCLPTEKAKHPLVQKLGGMVAFMKCIKEREIMVCMRQDFIKNAYKKGLDGSDAKLFELIMTFGEGDDPDVF